MTIKYYYVSGNTANGFINLIRSNVKGLKQIIVLNHPSQQLKTQIIRHIMDQFTPDHPIEVLCSSFGKEYLDGVIVRGRSLAVITDSLLTADIYQPIEIHLEKILDEPEINHDHSKEMNNSKRHRKEAYEYFSKGLKIHDNLEKIYIDEMDFNQADQIAEEFIENLLQDVPKKKQTPYIYRRLFGTNTGEGAINVVPQLIKNLNKRYYVKGRAGTGKSHFMKQVVQACKNHGLDLELYYCSFDPDSIDMVLIPELSFCMFDSTDPHEFNPEQDDDKVIDLYERTVTQGTEEKFFEDIQKITSHYKSYMKKGIECLKKAQDDQQKWEEKYVHLSKEKVRDCSNKVLNMIT